MPVIRDAANLRRASTLASESRPHGTPREYGAVVVGAGPAGVAVVGNLLERNVSPILWVDEEFNGGRVNCKYREVPSNTKVKLFIDFATAVSAFRKIVSDAPPRGRREEPCESDGATVGGNADRLQALRQLEPDKGCRLSHAADMILMLTEGLKRTPGVFAERGRATHAELDEHSRTWTVRLGSPDDSSSAISTARAKRLILCTGSSPICEPLPGQLGGIPPLDLDTALSPTRLTRKLTPLGPTTISVIGASHSAILALRNLYQLAASSKPDLKIRWLTRHALRYAEYMDDWILRDNTGLKGEAATWAKENLEPEVFPQSDASKYVAAIPYEKGEEAAAFAQHLPGSDFIVQAIGYTRNAIPELRTSDGKPVELTFDHLTGAFEAQEGKVPGLYGAGIAFPERVTDPYGNVEYAVGFMKFMKFVKRVSPDWN